MMKESVPPAPKFDPDGPVSFTETMARRRHQGKLKAGTAAAAPITKFQRPPVDGHEKPHAMDWSDFYSLEARSRHPCTLKAAAKQYLSQPGLISLGGGLPSADYFPLEQVNMLVHQEPFFSHLANNAHQSSPDGDNTSTEKPQTKSSQAVQPVSGTHNESANPPVEQRTAEKNRFKDGQGYDLSVALNYAQAAGSPQMLRYVTEHTEVIHSPPYADWGCALTPGSTAALEQAIRMLFDRGDSMVTDEYAFSTALETAWPLGIGIYGITMDNEGMVPEVLDSTLSNWTKPTRKPKVIYAVPTGQNPTGATMSEKRRRAIYQVARKHNMIIIEDDPYYFLQFTDGVPSGTSEATQPSGMTYDQMVALANEGRANTKQLESKGDGNYDCTSEWDFCQSQTNTGRVTVAEAVHYAARQAEASQSTTVACPPSPQDIWARALLPSFVKLDTDGRVIRLDSFSKTLMPGLRLGWITAPQQVVAKFVQHAEVCSQGASGVSQVIAWKLLDPAANGWGHDGYMNWLAGLSSQYQARRDILLSACANFLNFTVDGSTVEGRPGEGGLVTWDCPSSGMFLWITVDHTKHPDKNKSILDLENEIFVNSASAGVLLGRASWFLAEKGAQPPRLSFRATYAAAQSKDMWTAIERFSKAVKDVFQIRSSKGSDNLAKP